MISILRARTIVYPGAVVLGFVSTIAVVAQTSENVPAIRDPGSPTSLLCYPPPKTQTRVSIKLVGDPGVDLGPYLDESVLPVLRANWYRLISRASGVTGGTVGVDFSIQKDGTLGAAKVSSPSEGKLDALALEAVEASGPYRALPLDLHLISMLAHGDFSYKPAMDKPVGPNSLQAMTAGGQPLPYLRLCSADEISTKRTDCVVAPRVIENVDPDYTSEALQHMLQGTVVALVRVAVDGSTQSICTLNSLGDGLDQQAVAALRKWKFQPASYNDQPVSVEIAIETEFHLAPNDHQPAATLKESGQSQNPASADLADQPGVIQKGPGITPPQATYSPGATYTEEARRAKLDGDVVLNVTVTETGAVAAVTVVTGLGKGLDENAVEAVRKWKFKPGMRDGKPVLTQIAVEVSFHHL